MLVGGINTDKEFVFMRLKMRVVSNENLFKEKFS
jgi:hypothetical protein